MLWLSISAIIRWGWGVGAMSWPSNTSHFLSFCDIVRCLQSLRPYHGLLLLVEAGELLDHLPPDASPALVRLVRMYSPLKSLQTLSADADLTLSQVCWWVECWDCSIHASDLSALCVYTALAIWVYLHGAESLEIVCNHHHHHHQQTLCGMWRFITYNKPLLVPIRSQMTLIDAIPS